MSYWTPYDDGLRYARGSDDPKVVAEECRGYGVRVVLQPGDLADSREPERLIDAAVDGFGPLAALVMSHCESVDSSILDTSFDSWDQHFAVNARGHLVAGSSPR